MAAKEKTKENSGGIRVEMDIEVSITVQVFKAQRVFAYGRWESGASYMIRRPLHGNYAPYGKHALRLN